MNKTRVSIFGCKDGEIITEDVVNDQGVLVVVRNTIVNPYIQHKLVEHGIKTVEVLDSLSLDVSKPCPEPEHKAFFEGYKQNVTTMKQIIGDLALGKGLSIEKVHCLSQAIGNRMDQTSSIVQCLQLIKDANEYTYSHCINTAFYAMLAGRWLMLPEQKIRQLILAGLLHDVGKAKIPEDILNKKGPLTKQEYDIMKQHSILGYGIVCECEDIDFEIRQAVLLHHERIDRSGYPFNASPDSVGLFAKIIAVVDVFDAMTSERVYKKRSTPFDAFEMFTSIGYGIFDTTVMQTFIKNLSTHYVGMDVLLNDGRVGSIAYVPPQNIACPIVEVDGSYIDLSKSECRVAGMLGE